MCVANAWQHDPQPPPSFNSRQRVFAGQPHNANADHQQPLSVPPYPWYY